MIGALIRGVADAIDAFRRLAHSGSAWSATLVGIVVGVALLHVAGELSDAVVGPIIDRIDPLGTDFVRADPLGVEVLPANGDEAFSSYFYLPEHTVDIAGVAFRYERPLVQFLSVAITAAALLWLLLPQPRGAPPPLPMTRCPHCRSEIPAAARRCNSCRQPVEPGPSEVRVFDA